MPLTKQISRKIQKASATIPVLGVMIGEERWLVPMNDIGQILPVPKIITPVFLTHSWFLGVINAHGNLYGVCDLARYLHQIPTPIEAKSRLFLAAPRLDMNCAMLAGSVLGIRNLLEFTCQPYPEDTRPVVTEIYNDRQGRIWRVLNLPVLVRLKSFLQVAR